MRKLDDLPDSALLLSESPEAFTAFYRRHLPWVLRYLTGRVREREVAADLCGEVFAAALRARLRFDADAPSAEPWLQVIARNVLVDSLRRGQVEDRARRELGMQQLDLTDEDLDRLNTLVDEASGRTPAREAMRSLPADQCAAVLARVVDEEDYEVIAERLGLSSAVVRQRVSRGLRSLRATLEDQR